MSENNVLNNEIEVILAGLGELTGLVSLFDNYRQFYNQESDTEQAECFLRDRMLQKQSLVFLAGNKHTRIGHGFAQLYPVFSSVRMKGLWILNDLFVDECFRRLGIAEQLIETCQSFAKETGACELMLETAADNFKARELYKKTGFKKEEEFLTYRFLVDLC